VVSVKRLVHYESHSVTTNRLRSEIKMLDRILAIDVETTGFSPESGNKIIEIAAIEMIDL